MSIEVTDLTVTIGSHTILDAINLTCRPGEMLALVGASGSGKTTLLNCLGLLQRPTRGTIRVDGTDASGWGDRPRQRFWRDKAAFIYQDYGLIEDDSLEYNVTLTPRGLFRNRRRVQPRVEDALATVGLAGRALDRVSVLSGGEKQRAGVARALYKRASYIFADEPTASLDADNRDTVTRLLARAAADGACVVIATHDEELAAHADSAVTLGIASLSLPAHRVDAESAL
ncbi:ABC transporter ATP-binding protein [Actinotalea subterranea]|uniref:ABC transporter ATP-binding protein n=1 Tax=Actinotalea subterranea TaxID=2607497 RepID=UPI0011F04596|nr:ATP-binding cassette domain-containing protein [Actinotalea subterranea]